MSTIVYPPISSIKASAITQQLGVHSSALAKPLASRLDLWKLIAVSDEVIAETLSILLDSIDNALMKRHSHPNAAIQAFINESIEVAFDYYGFDYYKALREFLYTVLCCGFAVGETAIKGNKNAVGLTGVDVYDPTSIYIIPDINGRLTDDQPVAFSQLPVYKSGIYQTTPLLFEGTVAAGFHPPGIRHLPIYKRVYAARNALYGNYYGTSILEAPYRWHVFKEALIEILISASDQHGHPRAAFIIPNGMSGVQELDANGVPYQLTTLEFFSRQLDQINRSDNFFDSSKGIYLLPFIDKDLKPEVKVLSPGVSVAEDIVETIKFCQDNQRLSILTALGITENPTTIVNTIAAIHKQIITPYIAQVWKYILLHNFPEEQDAYKAVTLPLRSSLKPEDNVSLMQAAVGLTNAGYFNPTNKDDWAAIRAKVDMVDRELEEADVQWIKDRVLEKIASGGGSGLSGVSISGGDPVMSRSIETDIAGGAEEADLIRGRKKKPGAKGV